MHINKFRSIAIIGTVGIFISSLSSNAVAVTADNVICTGCVQSSDIADGTILSNDIKNYNIGQAKLYPRVILGKSDLGGTIGVRSAVNLNAIVFKADAQSTVRSVQVGSGGSATTNEDTDLLVMDPDFTASVTEPVMQMNASTGTLILGSGDASNNGESGELYIDNGAGTTNVWLFGTGQAYLGNTGSSGTLYLDDGTATWTSIVLSGTTGTISSSQVNGNGIVKAWALINADGTVASCYHCNTNTAETRLISGFTGSYEVDFTPIATDIRSRPWTCSVGNSSTFSAIGQIGCVQRSGDASSIFVETRDTTGAASNIAFTVVVY